MENQKDITLGRKSIIHILYIFAIIVALERVFKAVFRLSSTVWREEYRDPKTTQYQGLARRVQDAVSISNFQNLSFQPIVSKNDFPLYNLF